MTKKRKRGKRRLTKRHGSDEEKKKGKKENASLVRRENTQLKLLMFHGSQNRFLLWGRRQSMSRYAIKGERY